MAAASNRNFSALEAISEVAVLSTSTAVLDDRWTAVQKDAEEEHELLTLDDAMRAHIARALAITNGRIEGKGGAADRLGINPHTLRGKMRRLKIDWGRYRTSNVTQR